MEYPPMEDAEADQFSDHSESEANWPMELSLKDVNKTALEQLVKKIREELGTFGGAEAMFQQPAASEATALPRTSNYCADIIERCDEKPLWNALMGYGFLVVFCFALIGNCLNLLIYKSDHIRFFIAIRMLCTKLLMNTCMMVVMLPQALRVIRLWDVGDSTDQLYWRFWPYQAYLTNVFGFCAMWLTVLMTAECYIHIFFPSKSKLLCTKQTVWRSYFIILMAALILSSIYPLNRDVSLQDKCGRKIVKIITSQSQVMSFFESVHTIADMFLSILIPLSLLVFMTVMIVWRLWIWPTRRWRRLQANGAVKMEQQPQQNGHGPTAITGLLSNAAYQERKSRENHNHFSAEKRGVTRITLITCGIQLVTETPSMSVLIFVSMFGPNVHKQEQICAWQTVSYFLCLCNASLSFFVYITFSTRFRKTMLNRAHLLLHRLCPSLFPELPPSSAGIKHTLQTRMPNSSATPSQMVVLSSRDNSPRNGSQSEGKQQKLLVVSASEPLGGKPQSRSATSFTDLDCGQPDLSSASSKASSRNSPVNMDRQVPAATGQQQQMTSLSLAKRFLQQKLQNSKGPLRKLESDSLMTDTTNSLETIPPSSVSGHRLAQHSNSIGSASDCRPHSQSVNGRIMSGHGSDVQPQQQADAAETKRSSVCSTMTNTNSQFDAFL